MGEGAEWEDGVSIKDSSAKAKAARKAEVKRDLEPGNMVSIEDTNSTTRKMKAEQEVSTLAKAKMQNQLAKKQMRRK